MREYVNHVTRKALAFVKAHEWYEHSTQTPSNTGTGTIKLAERLGKDVMNVESFMDDYPYQDELWSTLLQKKTNDATYVVFEREAREFQSFHFFMFLLSHSNYKNITRIAHSYDSRKLLENQYSNAHSIVTKT